MVNHVAGGWTGTTITASSSQRAEEHQKNLWGPAGLGSQRKKLCMVCWELPVTGYFGGCTFSQLQDKPVQIHSGEGHTAAPSLL